jgi:hypothetical protein
MTAHWFLVKGMVNSIMENRSSTYVGSTVPISMVVPSETTGPPLESRIRRRRPPNNLKIARKVAGTLRCAVRSQAFASILGGRHMECAYYFSILGGRHMECAYYFRILGGRHMECAYYFDFCRLCRARLRRRPCRFFFSFFKLVGGWQR